MAIKGIVMKILDKWFKKKPIVQEIKEPDLPKKSDKELATERGEPYVTIVSMEIDPNNMERQICSQSHKSWLSDECQRYRRRHC